MNIQLPLPIGYFFLGIIALLCTASGLVYIMRRCRPERDYSELSARVSTWWKMAAIFLLAVLLSRTVTLIFFAFMSFLAFKE